jgi:hypothetical protein
MAAVLSVRVYTGTNAATESAAQTGISFLSIDSAATDTTTRQNNPVQAGTASFEKHLRLKIDTAPAVSVSNFLWWTDGAGQSNVNLRAKEGIGTGGAAPGTGDTTPTATVMTSDIDAYTRTSGAKGTWDSGSYSALNEVTKALLLQLQPQAAAAPGAWTQETINYSYDEV